MRTIISEKQYYTVDNGLIEWSSDNLIRTRQDTVLKNDLYAPGVRCNLFFLKGECNEHLCRQFVP
jgi:hypothetical protein